jgi:hypothetical protein
MIRQIIAIHKINLFQIKEETPFRLKRVTSRDPYQSIDLNEYYKSYIRHKELERGRQALEGAKVNIFSIFTISKEIFLTYSDLLK